MPFIPNVERPSLPPARQTRLLIGGAIAALVVVVLIGLNPFYQVSSGYVGVLMDFGSVQKQPLQPGLHFILPFYQSVGSVSVQPQTVTSQETASTHDLQQVNASIAVTFHVAPSDAPGFYENFRNFTTLSQRIITPAVSNDVKAVTANYDAEELVTKRDLVNAKIKSQVVASLAPYHLTVEAVNVSNFAFSDAYAQAIERKQVAQQQALQAQYTLQQAQITAQQQVVQAKAQADAAVATAQGQAQATLLNAQAEAKANDLVSKSLTPDILQLRAVNKWNGTLPTYLSPGAALPFIGAAAHQGGK